MTPSEQLELKLKLENKMRPELRALFNRMLKAYKLEVSKGGMLSENFLDEWKILVSNHSERVQESFVGVGDIDIDEDDDNWFVLFGALAEWRRKREREAALEISSTNMKQEFEAGREARQALVESGELQYSDREYALVATAIYRRKLLSRVNTIAITETQKSAESAKLMEAYTEAGLNPLNIEQGEGQPMGAPMMKKWQDVGDNKVRPGHRAAQVPKVQVDAPFIVNGERLMYPGDISLGASAGNTINCRCVSVYK